MSLLDLVPPFILGLVQPSILLYFAVKAYIQVLLQGLLENQRPPKDLRSKAFGKFWEGISPVPDPNAPLVGSATLVPPLLSQASGVVLDVGPGSGNHIFHFEKTSPKLTKIYGAEPATDLHKILRRNADATKVGGKYEILAADATTSSIARELVRLGVITSPSDAKHVFDTIICVRVLCSVPDLRSTITDLHTLLKPGGKLLICEHTANPWTTPKGSIIARAVQTAYMLMGWSYFIGDCELTRNIESELRRDSKARWESVDLERYFGKAVLTYISGVLVKKGR